MFEEATDEDGHHTVEIKFPVEFITKGTPVSLQSQNKASRQAWKDRVLESCRTVVPKWCFASADRITIIILYFSSEGSQGDIDNYVKLIIDALVPHIVLDDSQIDSVIARRFRPNTLRAISNPTSTLSAAMSTEPPAVYVCLHNDSHWGL